MRGEDWASEEVFKRVTSKIANFFPVRDGETLEDYCVRVREQHENCRAIVAATFVEAGKEIAKEDAAKFQAQKSAWIAEARRAFSPSERAACYVCGKYPYLTHAHHIYPLAQQYDDGLRTPQGDHVWLCPNHHAMVHLVLDSPANPQAVGRRLASPVLDLEGDELMRLLHVTSFDRMVVRR